MSNEIENSERPQGLGSSIKRNQIDILREKEVHFTARLKDVKRALEILEENPQLVELIDIMRKI